MTEQGRPLPDPSANDEIEARMRAFGIDPDLVLAHTAVVVAGDANAAGTPEAASEAVEHLTQAVGFLALAMGNLSQRLQWMQGQEGAAPRLPDRDPEVMVAGDHPGQP